MVGVKLTTCSTGRNANTGLSAPTETCPLMDNDTVASPAAGHTGLTHVAETEEWMVASVRTASVPLPTPWNTHSACAVSRLEK